MEHLSLSSSLQNEIQTDNSGLPEKKIGSQGLRKKIVKKGNSWQTPFPGDEVEGTKTSPRIIVYAFFLLLFRFTGEGSVCFNVFHLME
jgi:hypothetical protein